MKNLIKIGAALGLAIGAAACNGTGDPANNAAANATDNAAGTAAGGEEEGNASTSAGGKDPAGGAAAPAEPFTGEVNRTFLIGRWTDDGNCSQVIEFATDGSFTVPGGGSGLWVLDGDQLTFQGGAGRRTARVQAPDADTLLLINADGSIGRSTRCR